METTIRDELIRIIERFAPKRILVLGDLMLDLYTWGEVERISPEAPIPIIRKEKEEYRLGGAANVTANVNALNCEVFPVGMIGEGAAGQQILNILQAQGISSSGILTVPAFQTTVKQRILTRQQQLLRIDHEVSHLETSYENQLWGIVSDLIPGMDGIILSDYAKGVLSPALVAKTIQMAKAHQRPVVCDPGRGIDFIKYRGVTTLKPNRQETEQLSQLKLKDRTSILQAAAFLKDRSQAEFLTLSLDKDGILLFHDPERFQFIETEAREVYDVTGAGDIVIAVITVLLAAGIRPDLAIHMANVAAKLEISHLGVVSIPWSDIHQELHQDGSQRKISTLAALKKELADREGTPIVFTNGYFDNISAGHLRFLLEIGNLQGRLVVAINSDRSILQQRGSAPLLKEQDRARLLSSLETVYRVVIFDERDASEMIRQLKPDVVVKGEHFKDKELPELSAIQAVGAKIAYIRHFSW